MPMKPGSSPHNLMATLCLKMCIATGPAYAWVPFESDMAHAVGPTRGAGRWLNKLIPGLDAPRALCADAVHIPTQHPRWAALHLLYYTVVPRQAFE